MNTNQLFILSTDSKTIRFTTKGISEFTTKFAKVGIEINDIKTINQFKEAFEEYYSNEWKNAGERENNTKIREIMSDIAGFE